MMFLSPQDLIDLTGRRRHDAQASQLNRMGIVHKIRADGMPIVLKSHIAKEFDGSEDSRIPTQEPNLEGINA